MPDNQSWMALFSQRDKKAKKGCQMFLDDPFKQSFCVGDIWKPFLIGYRISSRLSALALQPPSTDNH